MAVEQGAFGCATSIQDYDPTIQGNQYSDNNEIEYVLSVLPNYYFVKGFYGTDVPRIVTSYQMEKAKNSTFLQTFMFVSGYINNVNDDKQKKALHKFLFSMYAIDVLPDIKYSIQKISCLNSNTILTSIINYPNPGDPARYLGICMRNLGVPFIQWDTNNPFDSSQGKTKLQNRYSITTFLNFLKKLEFLNTICIHDDLHGGNFVFDTTTNEFNIIDFGSVEFNQDHHRTTHSAFGISVDEIRPGDISTSNTEAKRLNDVLNNQQSRSAIYNNSSNYYWRTINVNTPMSAKPIVLPPPEQINPGFTYFDTYTNTQYFYYRLWGVSGELQSIFANDSAAFHAIVNNVHDTYRVGYWTLYRTNFWKCPSIVKFFSVLFSHPNPLCRPLSFNVRILLESLLKPSQNNIIFTKNNPISNKLETLFEIESLTGDAKHYSLNNLNYNTKLNHKSDSSIWHTNKYLKYYKSLNYYFMCYFIIYYFDDINNRNIFMNNPIDPILYCKPFYDEFIVNWNKIPVNGNGWENYKILEFNALKKLSSILEICEPHIINTDDEIQKNLTDIGLYGITFEKPTDLKYNNCP